MASFFALMQEHVLNRKAWITRGEPGLSIMTWIERTCNRRRRLLGVIRIIVIE